MRWPLRPERPRHSATTPWPAKAASPCSSSGITARRSSGVQPCWSCLARTLPSTTGSTISRCDGLGVSDRWTLLPSNSRSEDAPRWYFTSPEPSTSSGANEPPLNSWKRARCGLAITCVSTFRRPRWAMPTTISFTPRLPPRLMICSSAGISDSPPSRPKRFVPVNLTSRNFSKPSPLDELVEDRAFALAGEGDLLVRPLDALLQPRLLGRIGDVHELVADGRAVGALEDRHHLADGGALEAQHVVDEDLAVPVRVGEAVGRGMQLLMVLLALDAADRGSRAGGRACGRRGSS